MKYYKKELLSNRLALPNGKGVQFVQVGNSDTGVMATEDAGLISELDKAAAAGRGGVVEIDEQAYQELKKNPPVAPSRMKSLNAQSIRQLLANQNRARAVASDVAAVSHQPSAPMEVPDGKGLVTISTRRRLAELAKSEGAAPAQEVKAPAPAAPAHKPSVQKPSPAPAPAKATAAPPPPPPSNSATLK